jgi:hypothetical protein
MVFQLFDLLWFQVKVYPLLLRLEVVYQLSLALNLWYLLVNYHLHLHSTFNAFQKIPWPVVLFHLSIDSH